MVAYLLKPVAKEDEDKGEAKGCCQYVGNNSGQLV